MSESQENARRKGLKVVQDKAKTIPTRVTGNRRSIPLKGPVQIMAFYRRLVNDMYRDEIEPNKATRMAYIVSQLIDAMKFFELSERVRKLEERLEGNHAKH